MSTPIRIQISKYEAIQVLAALDYGMRSESWLKRTPTEQIAGWRVFEQVRQGLLEARRNDVD